MQILCELSSPSDASAMPSAIVSSDSSRLNEKVVTRKSSLRAMLEKPISSAVVMPMGSTYSTNWRHMKKVKWRMK